MGFRLQQKLIALNNLER